MHTSELNNLLPNGIDDYLYFHIALQICDVKNWQSNHRVCGDDRTLLSQKSIRSLCESIKQCCAVRPKLRVTLVLIHDKSSAVLRSWLRQCVDRYSNDQLVIQQHDLSPESGISASIKTCYRWMQDNGRHVVAQFQDDYIFEPSAVEDSVDILLQLQIDANTDAIVTPYHDCYHWKTIYRNVSSPRAIFTGKKDYWIQIYDLSCSWITTWNQFGRHWDLYEVFFELCLQDLDSLQTHHRLENVSLNYMTTQRAVLAINPFQTLSHHVQTQDRMDPHIDWRCLWNRIDMEL